MLFMFKCMSVLFLIDKYTSWYLKFIQTIIMKTFEHCFVLMIIEPHHEKTGYLPIRIFRIFAYAKIKAQISFAVTEKLICAFVFATRIVVFILFLNPKFQASSQALLLHRPVCVGPGRKPRRPVFLRRGSITIYHQTSRKTSKPS